MNPITYLKQRQICHECEAFFLCVDLTPFLATFWMTEFLKISVVSAWGAISYGWFESGWEYRSGQSTNDWKKLRENRFLIGDCPKVTIYVIQM